MTSSKVVLGLHLPIIDQHSSRQHKDLQSLRNQWSEVQILGFNNCMLGDVGAFQFTNRHCTGAFQGVHQGRLDLNGDESAIFFSGFCPFVQEFQAARHIQTQWTQFRIRVEDIQCREPLNHVDIVETIATIPKECKRCASDRTCTALCRGRRFCPA